VTLAEGTRLGPYEILAPLGAGGMGEVYRARDTRLDRQVAIKVLPERLLADPTALARFEAEAKALAALSHPNILALHDFGNEHGVAFAVMELLEGETLRDRLAGQPLAWRRAVEITLEIAEGLTAAHDKSLVHRDLKPENLFLLSTGRTKILDFGLARPAIRKDVDPSSSPTATVRTRPGGVVGTAAYLSPEQIRGEDARPASDVFALGCVLYEMIAGRRPFTGHTAEETMGSILHEEPPDPTTWTKDVPPELVRVIRKCLEKDPTERYGSAREVALALRDLDRPRPQAKRRSKTIDSLAILPFVNASRDPQADYLSDGLTESLIYGLSRLPGLRVMARATMFRYKGKELDPQSIGRELGVRAVLAGTLSQRGDALVVHTELVDVDDGSQLWGERYARKLEDILTVEEQIAAEITEKLKLRLTQAQRKKLARRPKVKSEAYQLYLQGRHHWNRRTEESLRKGIELFRQALAADPDYAPAYVGLADSHAILGFYGLVRPRESFPLARTAAEKALELDPDLAEAHASLGYVRHYHDWDWKGSVESYRRAQALNPNYAPAFQWYAVNCVSRGKVEDGVTAMDRALTLDPLSLIINAANGWLLYYCRNYDGAIARCHTALELDPHFPQAHLWLGWALEQRGRYDEAIAEYQEGATSLAGRAGMLGSLGHAYAAAGRPSEARRVLDELETLARNRHVPPYETALIHTGLGDHDAALTRLEHALEERSVGMAFLRVEPRLDPLRSDPRFATLLEKTGLGGR
jgi:eukaryotic-like serine/threonine-protein kinase